MKTDTIFDFIRFAVDDGTTQLDTHEKLDWNSLFDFSVKQTLTGVMYRGIEKLKRHPVEGVELPEKKLLLKWYMHVERIRKRNKTTNADAVELTNRFRSDGFRGCILKGQGIACLYPDPSVRVCGDIDIWIDADRKRIVDYVNSVRPGQHERYIHIDFPLFKQTEVEVHYTPSYMYNPIANKRLQKWFRENAMEQFDNTIELPEGVGTICVPTAAFNRIFILSHIYKHLFSEGIGLRQLMDYYYVLKCGFTPEMNAADRRTLRELGMLKFAGAVMYVLKTVFGLEDRFLIVEPDEKNGQFLLSEILLSGNFGHYDERFGTMEHETKWQRYVRMTRRNLRFVSSYPGEAVAEPLFRTWFFFWKVVHRKK